jgi:hypothetical protein
VALPIRRQRSAAARKGANVSKGFWATWAALAGLLMIVMGTLDVVQGLIAVIRSEYYVLTSEQIIVFDLTTWGWLTLLWGIVIIIGGLGLIARQGWARWFTITVASLNFLVQLGFVGSSDYPLWALTGIALNVLVLYALTVRWQDVKEVLA